ncbi:hypothetical protein SAMN05421690_102317 [Nitrosomonas sp. Nm51]|nr:hypothetical protein SAMN05421690_102317 [Nitrosomonas sp. Nm51]
MLPVISYEKFVFSVMRVFSMIMGGEPVFREGRSRPVCDDNVVIKMTDSRQFEEKS